MTTVLSGVNLCMTLVNSSWLVCMRPGVYYCCCILFEGVDEDAPAGTAFGAVLVCKLSFCTVEQILFAIHGAL